MPMFYVYKKEWDHYVENRGYIVIASSWQRAKGIAINKIGNDVVRKNILVREIIDGEEYEGILCATDGIMGTKKLSKEY